VIVSAGFNPCPYGDVIAEKTGMGRTWDGVVLTASVTSLPELIAGSCSVVYMWSLSAPRPFGNAGLP